MPYLATAHERLFYALARNAPVRPERNLILVHGAGGNHTHWPPELRRLAGFNVYALDLPGHGRSPGNAYTELNAYAETVLAFAEGLGLSAVTLVGHSMGGGIALLAAARQPGWLQRLVIIASGVRLPVEAGILDNLARAQADAAAHSAALERICQLAYGPTANSALLHQGRRTLAQLAPALLYADYLACSQYDARDQAARVQVPSLVLVGASDRLTPPSLGRQLGSILPKAQLVEMPDAGHMLVLERPQQTAQLIASWLDDARPA